MSVAETFPSLSSDLFGDQLEAFARAVENSRHGHAHALEGSRSIDSGEALSVSADALMWLLRASVMVDLGLDVGITQERIRHHERFGWTVRRLRDVLRTLDDSVGG